MATTTTMAVLRDREVVDYRREKHFSSATSLTVEKLGDSVISENSRRVSRHGSLTDMLLWLKCVAVDPLNIQLVPGDVRVQNQIRKAKHFCSLDNNDYPRRKRKLNRLLQEGLEGSSDLSLEEQNERGVTELNADSSIPCLVNCGELNKSFNQILHNPQSSIRSLKFGDNLSRKRVPKIPSYQSDKLDVSSSSGDGILFLDSDDSISRSSSLSLKNSVKHSLHSSSKFLKSGRRPSTKHVHSIQTDLTGWIDQLDLELSPFDLAESIGTLIMTDPAKATFSRAAIPVGPRFQADIPEWTGPPKTEHLFDDDDNLDILKWLGTKVWPLEGRNLEASNVEIGKGRSLGCLCQIPGSTMCIKHHIKEGKARLQFQLGPAFFTWKFDEMGEIVSGSWTHHQQESFKVLVKQNVGLKNTSFLKPAMRCFPCKSRENVVSYYFNVFVPQQISRQTRLGIVVMDSDEDETEGKSRKSKDVTPKYLTQS
ncbi:hypothetical protein GIB67_027352 [Kingdonia uniflora]|uniref:ELM2 domain-containing protein n=1 Tax=Kingdonia uniflora TaxID=39325 RepID=A0A7J7MF02_9MAGN|nr:hypothetical protein GIB67_027352 [Kingdonia uniflora]